MILDALDADTRGLLDRYGFDPAMFETLRGRVVSGELSQASNVVRGSVEPPRESDLARLPEPGTGEWSTAREAGIAAIRGGRVAQAVLAGGMATRFGGVVKGAVEALDGRSFLSWKLGETALLGEAVDVAIPVVLMTSFQTDDATRAHVATLGLPEPLWFTQSISLRPTEGGDLFEEEGQPSPYAPGHGDLVSGIRSSGTLDLLRARGVEHVAVSNVDNLGARLDPVVVGTHLVAGRPVTVEVAPKEGDLGGAPARVDGRLGAARGPAVPARARSGADSRLQHELRDDRTRRARPRLRPPLAPRAQAGRRSDRGAARAPLPPGLVGARDDLPRGSALRSERTVLPDQGARGPRALPGRTARAARPARARHVIPRYVVIAEPPRAPEQKPMNSLQNEALCRRDALSGALRRPRSPRYARHIEAPCVLASHSPSAPRRRTVVLQRVLSWYELDTKP